MLVIEHTVMMRLAVFNVVLHGEAEAQEHRRIDLAVARRNDFHGAGKMLSDNRAGAVMPGCIKQIAFRQYDEIGAGDLILEHFFHGVVVLERFIGCALALQCLDIVSHTALCEGRTVHDRNHAVHSDANS